MSQVVRRPSRWPLRLGLVAFGGCILSAAQGWYFAIPLLILAYGLFMILFVLFASSSGHGRSYGAGGDHVAFSDFDHGRDGYGSGEGGGHSGDGGGGDSGGGGSSD